MFLKWLVVVLILLCIPYWPSVDHEYFIIIKPTPWMTSETKLTALMGAIIVLTWRFFQICYGFVLNTIVMLNSKNKGGELTFWNRMYGLVILLGETRQITFWKPKMFTKMTAKNVIFKNQKPFIIKCSCYFFIEIFVPHINKHFFNTSNLCPHQLTGTFFMNVHLILL